MRSIEGRVSAAVARSPEGLPMLDRGAHCSPEQGACLMEYVSVLAGTRFSDRPQCTHPALAQLARMVNDETTEPAARSRLAMLAPDLIGTRTRDPRITRTVMVCCLRAARAACPQDRDVQQALHRAEMQVSRLASPRARRYARCRSLLWEPEVFALTSTLRTVLKRTHRFHGPRHDEQLRELLERALTDCRGIVAAHSTLTVPEKSRPAVRRTRTGRAS